MVFTETKNDCNDLGLSEEMKQGVQVCADVPRQASNKVSSLAHALVSFVSLPTYQA